MAKRKSSSSKARKGVKARVAKVKNKVKAKIKALKAKMKAKVKRPPKNPEADDIFGGGFAG